MLCGGAILSRVVGGWQAECLAPTPSFGFTVGTSHFQMSADRKGCRGRCGPGRGVIPVERHRVCVTTLGKVVERRKSIKKVCFGGTK